MLLQQVLRWILQYICTRISAVARITVMIGGKKSCNNRKCQCHHRRCQCLHKSYIIVDHVKCHDRQNKIVLLYPPQLSIWNTILHSLRITYKLSITLSPFHTSSTISSECDYISLPAVSLPDAFYYTGGLQFQYKTQELPHIRQLPRDPT